ncbi:MAG: succinoglycan biosynthesis protein ExoA [Solirubrobacteraceae bacterium]|nr:succinoglycan biosynthesis protein ExoA [Solirubrobacteraceae bacterium]
MPAVAVSVLIPVLNEAESLRECAARMLAQELDGEAEFLFIDGGSDDGSGALLAELAAEDPRIRVLENPQRRTPFALNIGLRAARGEYIARMDAHTRYPPDYLQRGRDRLAAGGVVSASGPQLAVGDGRGWSDRVALALQTPLGVGGAGFRRDAGEEFEVDTGFTGMWRRDVLLEAGGWDEEWLTDQDCELAFRLAAGGGRHVCLPAMAAEYIPRRSLQTLRRQYWQYGLHKVKTFQRHPGAMRPSHLLPPVVTAAVAATVLTPRPIRTLARAGTALYVSALVVTAARAAAGGARPADAASLPAVFATMHLAYGAGLFAGVRRYGVPSAAILSAVHRVRGR